MKMKRTTDIIRHEERNYVNVNTENRLIAKMLGSSAEQVYGFRLQFGRLVDEETNKEMQGTYWLHVPNADEITVDDGVAIVEL